MSDRFVNKVRPEVVTANGSQSEPRTYVTKHGTKATMNTALLLGRRYNRAKKSHGGDRKSKDQNDPLNKSTAERLGQEEPV